MKKLLESFSFNFGQLQDISTLLKHLKDNDVSIVGFIEYVEQEKINRSKYNNNSSEDLNIANGKCAKAGIACSMCGSAMYLYDVNTNPRDNVGDNLNSQWFCNGCWHSTYSEKTAQEILKERGK